MTSRTNRPPLINQATHIFWQNLLRQKPLLASFKLTYKCNLRCQQCPFCHLQSAELSLREVCTILEDLYSRGNRIVIFEGGEPTLWQDNKYSIIDVLIYARQIFYSVGITTNGTRSLDLPADVVWVSIDGFEQTHNELRGANIFAKIMQNVKASLHPKLFAHVTVNAVNAPEVSALVRYLNDHFKGITVQFYYPYNSKDDLFLPFDMRSRLLDELIALKRSGIRILNSVNALQALKANTWRCYDRLMDNVNPDGTMQQGCYLKGRGDIDCSKCGFSPHTEISLAVRGNLGSILAGKQIFTA